MPTYVSILNWSGTPQPTPAGVQRAIEQRAHDLRRKGLHSVVLLPDEGECAAILVTTAREEAAVSSVARSIFPAAAVHCETVLFDAGDDTVADRVAEARAVCERETLPPSPAGHRHAMLGALAHDPDT